MTQHVRVFAFACVRVCAPTKKTTFFRWEKPKVTARWPTYGVNHPLTYFRWPTYGVRWPTYGDLLTVTYLRWPTSGDLLSVTTRWPRTLFFSYDVIVTLIPHIAHTPLSSRTQPFLIFFHDNIDSWQFDGFRESERFDWLMETPTH